MDFNDKYGFTGNKDTDRLILLNLNGPDLLKACSLNKRLNSICDEEFFENLIKGTPLEPVKLRIGKYLKTKRNFYAVMMYYIGKLKEIFNYDYEEGDPKLQYLIFSRHEKNMNNFLLKSVEFEQLPLVKYAIIHGANIHYENDKALLYAASNDLEGKILKYLLDLGLHNDTAVVWAAMKGRIENLKYLEEQGYNIHIFNDLAFNLAARNGEIETLKYLLEKGTNINGGIIKALFEAANNNKYNTVVFLIENGANIHENFEAALRFACINGFLDIAEYLVENGADINVDQPGKVGGSLRLAAENGHLYIVKYLIQSGSDPNNLSEETLKIISKRGHIDVLKYLFNFLK